MRYTPQHKSITHKKIVSTAADLFRAQSIGGVGVSDLMSRAGLTHGGFYAHFSSKEALAAEAIKAAFDEARQRRKQVIGAAAPGRKFYTAVELYLTMPHRDNPGKGCMAAALASEVAHHPGPVRDAMTAGVKRWVAGVEQMLQEDGLAIDGHTAIATLVGALVLSRAMADPELAERFVTRARDSLLASAKRATPSKRSTKRARS
jgi:TetR/AcrR family transcriptional repressor of nem operon